jgi:uncharacterized surface protein with fasciclin (FAS1) repeats
MKILHKIKQIAIFAILIATASSCDDTIEDIGKGTQNYTDVFSLVKNNTNLTIFNKAIELSNLGPTLNNTENYTYFAPNDVAFEAFLVKNGYVNSLGYPDITLVPVDKLKEIVLSHIVKGVKKRIAHLATVDADYLETGQLTTMANPLNPDLYLLDVNVTADILKVNGSNKAAAVQDIYGSNGFLHILDNVISLFPPAPIISGVSQAFASPGDVITLTGMHFVNVRSVKFGDEVAIVVGTPTNTSMNVEIPANFGSYALITVTTEFGTSAPATIGVKYLLYGDNFSGSPTPGWTWNWGGNENWQSTELVSRGTYSIKRVNVDAWSGLMIGYNSLKAADYQFLKLSIYSTVSKRILFSIAGQDDANGIAVDIKAGEWNNISIPFTSLHTELLTNGEFNSLFMKEYSGDKGIVYLDDIGFL